MGQHSMPLARNLESSEPSTEAMVAEHQRLSDLYLYNTEMGEKRTTLYLTVVSAGAALLLGMAQFHVDQSFLLWSAMGMLGIILVIGLLTFYRLVERRIRGMEYLRAINRVHRYFVDRDPALADYYYWAACDDTPYDDSTDAATMGLRDLISVLNSLFLGALVGVMAHAFLPAWHIVVFVLVGLAIAPLAWLAQERYERRRLQAEEKKSEGLVRFPGKSG